MATLSRYQRYAARISRASDTLYKLEQTIHKQTGTFSDQEMTAINGDLLELQRNFNNLSHTARMRYIQG